MPRAGVVALALLALSIGMTWPLGRVWQPELPDLPDSAFNVWRLTWIAHQLVTEPTRLFEANIFYPAQHTLAYSDAMLFVGLLAAPWLWLGVHPYVVHNLAVIAAFWAASFFTYRLCLRVTSHHWGAVAGAVVGGFAPYRFGHIAHLELLWTAFLPLGLTALIALCERPTIAASLRLGLYQVLQTLCSIYYGIYYAIYLALAAVAVVMTQPPARWRRIALALGGAAIATLVVLAPYVAVYREARRLLPERTPEGIAQFSAVPRNYLEVSNGHTLPLPRNPRASEERSLYPGAIAVLLAIVGVARGGRTALMYAAPLIVCVDLSFGVNGFVYPLLLSAVPLLASLRAPARFGAFVLLNLSVLTALGTARLLASPARARRVGPVLALAMAIEYLAVPVTTRRDPVKPPALYAWLAQQPPGVVLEMPLPTPESLWAYETDYQLMSIFHWKPLVNGYSGHAPADYIRFLGQMRTFPADETVPHVQARRVRWVIIHEALFDRRELPDLMEKLLGSKAFRSVGTYSDQWGRATVFELTPTTM